MTTSSGAPPWSIVSELFTHARFVITVYLPMVLNVLNMITLKIYMGLWETKPVKMDYSKKVLYS